jgi:hypothetical protein
MNSSQKELFRIAVLEVLNANPARHGLGVEAVCHFVSAFGFQSPETADADDALDYLARRHFIEEVQKPISPENRMWRICGPGIAFLDQRS